ncbi:hypothetical protein AO069_15820 [Pseudomonas syringae pv. syringae PD2774]|uniref:hypothetical protein n=1 Tax=Pseudomonas syringae TaxID=317 RepID=UPI000736515F|nr:hypothetical protein [Pseudomonas syringae]KTB93660.1 hypothetical protein AO069_15820 [Pseudomonas syringae pv. syringae PD2774]
MSTHEMTDAMKAEFVKAFQAKFGFGVLTASSNDDAAAMMGAAAWAWQASREELVIELPEHYQYDNPGEAFHAIKDCREAIEATGVKVTQ